MKNRGFKTTYVKNLYGSRGAMRTRDKVWEGFVAGVCKTCLLPIERGTTRRGQPQSISNWLRMKTHGKIWVDNVLTPTSCFIESIKGEGNPNYKGYMPTCAKCGKRLKTYGGVKRGVRYSYARHCKLCYETSDARIKHDERLSEISKERGVKLRGVQPKHLKEYMFKKGQKSWNKVFDFCTEKDCTKKHLAKGLCSTHYQQKRKIKSL